MISDIDGTITKSDLLGHLLPRVGFDWSHRGVTRLFTNIKANGYVFMFLSSRAIAQASATRDYLHTLNQDGETLPAGPVIISPDGLFPSLYRELVRHLHKWENRFSLARQSPNPHAVSVCHCDELSYAKQLAVLCLFPPLPLPCLSTKQLFTAS